MFISISNKLRNCMTKDPMLLETLRFPENGSKFWCVKGKKYLFIILYIKLNSSFEGSSAA